MGRWQSQRKFWDAGGGEADTSGGAMAPAYDSASVQTHGGPLLERFELADIIGAMTRKYVTEAKTIRVTLS